MKNKLHILSSFKKSFLTFSLALLFVALSPAVFSSCASSRQAGGDFYADNIADFSEKKLSNGIPVYFKQNRGSKIAVVRMIFEGGVPLYEGKIDGIEAFTLDMMLRGSERYSFEEIQKLKYEKSFSMGSSKTKDFSSVGFTCISRDFNDVTDVFADVILHPLFDNEVFNQLYSEAEDTVSQTKADPSGLLGIELSKLVFENHPYQVSVSAREGTLSKITLESVKNQHKLLMNASRVKFVVVADLNPQKMKEVLGKLDSYFNVLPKAKLRLPSIPDYAFATKTVFASNAQAGDSGYITGVFDCPDRNDSDYIPFAISTMILDDMMFDKVREKEGALYSAGTGIIGGKKFMGVVSLYKANTSKNLKEIVKKTVLSFDEEEVKESIEQYKNKYITKIFQNSTDAWGIAENMVSGIEYSATPSAYLTRPQKVHSVTAKQVIDAYNKYIRKAFEEDKVSWIVVGSEKKVKSFGF